MSALQARFVGHALKRAGCRGSMNRCYDTYGHARSLASSRKCSQDSTKEGTHSSDGSRDKRTPSIYPHSRAAERKVSISEKKPLFNHTLRPRGFLPQSQPPASYIASAITPENLKAATNDPGLQKIYARLGAAANINDAADALAICEEIKQFKGKSPNRSGLLDFKPQEAVVFFALMQVIGHQGLYEATCAVHRDMDRCGLPNSVDSLNYLLMAAIQGDFTEGVFMTLDRIAELPSNGKEDSVLSDGDAAVHQPIVASLANSNESQVYQMPPDYTQNWNSTTCSHLLRYCFQSHNLELALAVFSASCRMGIKLPLDAIGDLIETSIVTGDCRIAAEIAHLFEQGKLESFAPNRPPQPADSHDVQSNRKLPSNVWHSILRSCAENGYLPGVELAWQRTVVQGSSVPEEGIILQVLHLAAKESCPQLAKLCLKAIEPTFRPDDPFTITPRTALPRPDSKQPPLRQTALQDHHLAPLFEAQCAVHDYASAFKTLLSFEVRGIPITKLTARRISISMFLDPPKLDSAIEAVYKRGRDEEKGIDIMLVNAVLDGGVWIGARQKVLDLFNNIPKLHTFSVTRDAKRRGAHLVPNLETYHTMLNLCQDTKDIDYGRQLLTKLNKYKLKPDAVTYERIILLCLLQTDYEDAFRFIEEAKDKKLIPTRITYQKLIRRCLTEKDRRYKRAFAEMEHQGYKPSPGLTEAIAQFEAENRSTSPSQKIATGPIRQRVISQMEQSSQTRFSRSGPSKSRSPHRLRDEYA